MVRTTTTRKISHLLGDIKHFFILTAIVFLSTSNGNAKISNENFHSFIFCPDINPPSVIVYNSDEEIISNACTGDSIFIEIELIDIDEVITSFVFYQDLNSNSEFDPGEEMEIVDYDIDENIGIFKIVSSISGQISFDILVSDCIEYTQTIGSLELINCDLMQELACYCLDNADYNIPGEFADTYSYSTYDGDVLTVIENIGAVNPDDQNFYSIGYEFNSDVDGIIEIIVEHTEGVGYNLSLENSNGQIVQLSNSCSYPNPEINIVDSYCTNHPDIDILVTSEDHTGSFEVFLDGNPISVLSPSNLSEGTYLLEYTFTADPSSIPSMAGCTSYRSFEIEIFGDSPSSLVCNTFLNLSLSSAGYFVLTSDVLISDSGIIGCYSSFELEIFGQDHDTIFCSQVGDQIFAMVTDPSTNSTCFSTITVFDKTGPIISGPDTVVVNCGVDENDPILLDSITVSDNCSSEIDLIYEDYHFNFFFCDDENPGLVKQFIRRYTATDEIGNTSIFEHLIQFVRPPVSEIDFPLDTILACDIDDSLLDPEFLGAPSFDGVAIDLMNCTYQVTFSDTELPAGCSGRNNIRRTWSVLDPCNATFTTMHQFINFVDTISPIILCPDTINMEVAMGTCSLDFILPSAVVTDNCTDDVPYFTLYQNDIVFSDEIELNVGVHSFTIYANDFCGNLDSCSYIVNILDNELPEVSCNPITVELDEFGEVFVGLEDLDLSVSDNCGILDTLIRRANQPDFGTELYFTCYDITEPVEINVQVSDINGNITEMSCFINVEDNIDPIIDCGTAFSPIDCNDIPFNLNDLFPIPDFSDNCIIGSTDNDIVSNLNSCFEGELVRTFTATDISGNSTTCIQVIEVDNTNILTESDIIWPTAELLLEECVPNIDSSVTGAPTIDASDICGEIEVTFSDEEDFDDVTNCIVIERTWEVTDVCEFDSSGGASGVFTFVQEIRTRPLDYTLDLPADVMVDADGNCEAFVELAAAVAFNCVQDITISNDFDAMQGAQVSGVFGLGITEIEFSSVDGCGVMKSGIVTVTVVDNTAPFIVDCPDDVTISCSDDISDLSIYGEVEATDNCGIADIDLEETFNLSDCEGGEIVRVWTVIDAAGNESICEQVITVNETEALELSDIIWPTAELLLEDCVPNIDSSVTGAPIIDASDICGEIEVTFSDEEDFDDVTNCIVIERTWEVTDVCEFDSSGGASGVFTFVQEIRTRPLDYTLDLPADVMVDADGNCEAFVELAAAVAFNCVQDITISNYFDAIQGAQVSGVFELGVTEIEFSSEDGCGIVKSGIVTVTVVDNTAPIIVDCPDDVTISCSDDISDLSIYGEVEATDNCGIADIDLDETFNLSDCEGGEIERVWTVTDAAGNESICEQIITVNETEALELSDIIWPTAELLLEDCVPNIDSSVTGAPIIDASDICGEIEVAFSDEEDFDDVTNCIVIERTWEVTDVCEFDSSGGASGVFTFVQEIRTRPLDYTLDLPADVMVDADGNCEAFVELAAAVAFNCVQDITISNDFDAMQGAQVSGVFGLGVTEIEFSSEDGCGIVKSGIVTVTVVDNTAPFIVDCPDDVTISCSDDISDLSIYGEVEATDNCGIADIDLEETFNLSDCEGGEIVRVWTVIDAAGNESICEQVITVNETEALELSDIIWPTAELLLEECVPNIDSSVTGAPTIDASDICGEIEVTFSDEEDFDDVTNCIVIERTWEVTDVCEFDSSGGASGVFTFVQEIRTRPLDYTLDLPADVMVDADGNCEAFVELSAAVAFNCVQDITISNDFDAMQGAQVSGVFGLGITEIEFSSVDGCGVMKSGIVTVTVEDNTAPVIVDCPANVTISCSDDISDLSIYGEVEATDNCGIADIDLEETFNLSDCEGGEIVRVWTVIDAAGNESICEQIITVNETEALELSDIIWPTAELLLEDCVPNIDSSVTGAPIIDASDICGEIEVTFSDEEDFDDVTNCIVFERTWEVTDVCEFDSSGGASGVFTFVQEIRTRPLDYTLDLPADVMVDADGNCEAFVELSAAVAFNCVQDITITNDFDAMQGAQVSGVFGLGITEIEFSSVDGCGVMKSGIVTVTVEDNTAPVIVDCPADVTISCSDDISDLSIYGEVEATDNCGIADIDLEETFNLSDCEGGEIVRVWTVTDAAGNESICEQIITVNETEALELSEIFWPTAELLLEECVPNIDSSVTGAPIIDASDICGEIEVAFSDEEDFDDVTNCIVIERTWEVTDVCEFESSGGASGVFTFVQEIRTRPLDYTLELPADVMVDADGNCEAFVELAAAVAFNCVQDITITNDFDAMQGAQVSGVFGLGVTEIEFSSEDGCGIVKSGIVTVTVVDNTVPVIVDCPANVTISCSDDISDLSIYGEVEATDNCGIADIDLEETFNLSDCEGGEIVRVWTVIDAAGNESICEQIITVNETEALELSDIIWPTAELLLEECVPNIDSSVTGAPTIDASDICGEIEVAFSDEEDFDDVTNCIVIERTWEVTDVCEFESSGGASGVFTFVQEIRTRPLDYTLDLPADVMVDADGNCEAFVELSAAVAFNCVQDITISNDFDAMQGAQVSGVFGLGITEIEFSSVDGCGVMKSGIVTVTVEDNTAPVIVDCPANVTIACSDDISDLSIYGEVEATDNCGIADIDLEETFNLSDCGEGEIVRVWTVIDAAGNESICEQIITVEGPEALGSNDILWPEDTEVFGCNPNYDPSELGEPILPLGECRILEITYIDVEDIDIDGCPIIQRNWTVIDNCDLYLPGENIFSHTQIIFKNDDNDFDLIIQSVYNLEIDPGLCEAFLALTLEIDGQCESAVDVSWEINFPSGDMDSGIGLEISEFYPVGTTNVIFTVESECFGVKTANVEINVEDNEAPTIMANPGDILISCTNMSFDITSGFTAFDVCGIDTTFAVIDTISVDNCGVGVYEVIFTAIDVNGNSASDFRIVEFFNPMDGIFEDDFNVLQDTIDIICNEDFEDTGVLEYIGPNICIPIEITYEDLVDNSQPGFCAVISRTWTAFSPCDDDDNIYTFTQVIRIEEDDTAPDLSAIQDTTVYIASGSCEAYIFFDESLIEECLLFSLTNDSPFADNGDGLPSGSYPPGNYVVEMIAEDYCGNITFKSIIISVIDTIAPEVDCFADLEFSLVAGEIEISVDQLAVLGDPMCSNDYLTFSAEGDPSANSIILECTDLGLLEFTIYGFDETGNSDSCTVIFNLIDLELDCGSKGGRISGTIKTIYDEKIGNVDMVAETGQYVIGKQNLDGEYLFNVQLDRGYKVTAQKIDEMFNGVTILDLILLAQYIINDVPLASPYYHLAADVNNDRKINFNDLVELRSVMMRRQTNFSGGKSWRFIPESFDIGEATNVFNIEIPESIYIENLSSDMDEQNFIGIKIGDINNTAVKARSAKIWNYEISDSGTKTNLHIYPNNSDMWLGMDLNLNLPAGAKISKYNWTGGNEASHVIFDGELINNSVFKLIGYSTSALNNSDTQPVLNIEFENLPSNFDFESLFRESSEAVSMDYRTHDLSFRRLQPDFAIETSVYPNPFTHTSNIELLMNKDEENVKFSIIDKMGREIYSQKRNFIAGKNLIEINSQMINTPGVYFYKVEFSEQIVQGQIIKIE